MKVPRRNDARLFRTVSGAATLKRTTRHGQGVTAMNRQGVVVGFDGSQPSIAALRWAVSEAVVRGVPLTVCHAGRLPQGQTMGPGAGAGLAGVPGMDAASDGVQLARQIAPGITVHRCYRQGAAADMLLEVAEDGDLLVMGVRGSGVWAELGLGSVSARAAAHARTPVVFVHGDGRWHGEKIVVGVDDSAAAEAAAGFAFEEAALHGVPLTAVLSWWIPPLPVPAGYLNLAGAATLRGRGGHPTYGEEMRQIAEDRLTRVLTPWHAKFPAVAVTSALVTDAPPKALREAAGHAGLLVVGSRGLSPLRRLLLGSVSQVVAHEAPCAVAVIHAQH